MHCLSPSLLLLLSQPLLAFLDPASGIGGEARQVSYSGHQVWRVEFPAEEGNKDHDRNLLTKLDDAFDVWRISKVDSVVTADVAVSPEDMGRLEFTLAEVEAEVTSVVVEDVQEAMDEQMRKIRDRAEVISKNGRAVDFDLSVYHPYDDILQYLLDLEEEYYFVSTELVGTSFEGRDLRVLKICTGDNGCGNKPIMWIDGGIHAREWISPATAVFLIDTLVQGLPEEDEELLRFDWHFLPVLNPDGYVYTWEVDRNWRKTRHVIPENTCIGVDPNRNFGHHWNEFHLSNNPCVPTYHGPEPWSEVELAALRDYVTSLSPDVVYYANLHSFSQLIMYPWGYSKNQTADAEDQQRLGDVGNEALFATHGTVYEVGPHFETIYPAAGISIDWAYGEAGIKYSYIIELRDTGEYAFLLPPEQIVPTGEEIYAFHAAVAKEILREIDATMEEK